MRAIIIIITLAIVGGLSSVALADTFEDKATGGVKIAHLDDLVWVATATCDKGDDVGNRQCRQIRDTRLAQLAGKPLLVEADPKLFSVGAWSAAKKSAQVTLSGCLACGGVTVGGKSFIVLATTARVDGGKISATPISDKALPFDSEAARTTFATSVKNVRVELVVKLGDKPRWQLAGKDGVTLELVGYRVINVCEGSVVLASPASGAIARDPKACTDKK